MGEETIDGKSCYRVVMTPTEGPVETHYYDKDSSLLTKVEGTRLFSNMPPMPMEVTYSDYEKVDGLLIPHKKRQATEQCGSTREIQRRF